MRHFLFLQGPHGPFFAGLAKALRSDTVRCSRVGFNLGDQIGWRGQPDYVAFKGAMSALSAFLTDYVRDEAVTDVVLYGDHRDCHREAIAVAQNAGLRVHFLEEGYLRPHWITYERGGVNGSSPLMDMSLAQIEAQVVDDHVPLRAAPDQWGAALRHMFWGLGYHAVVMIGGRIYPKFQSHRGVTLLNELNWVLRRVISQPARAVRRRWREARLHRMGVPYHVVLLQLGHDASVQAHSRFNSMAEFMAEVFPAFAAGAPAHHHLVLKAHPFEDGRENLSAVTRKLSRAHGLEGRVHFLEGQRLAGLLDAAQSVVTVNSTAAQQALWRGLPVRAFGRAIYSKAALVSDQPLHAFFATPDRPEMARYLAFRQYLLQSSQIKGSFYTAAGRAAIRRVLVDVLLNEGAVQSQLRDMRATDAANLRHVSPQTP